MNGALDALSARQLRRVLDTVPTGGPLVIDLSHAEFVDHHALYVLAQSATADRTLRIRGGAHLRKLASLIGAPDSHMRFEDDAGAALTRSASE